MDPLGRGLPRGRALRGRKPVIQRPRGADPRDRWAVEGVWPSRSAHGMDRRPARAYRRGGRDKGLHDDRAGHPIRGARRDSTRTTQAAPGTRAVSHQRAMAAPRRLGRGPFARAALDTTGGGRDLLLQLPVPDRLDGPRRPAYSRVQHDDRAGHPIPRGAASADRIRNDVAGAALRTLGDRPFAHDHRLTTAAVDQPPTITPEEQLNLDIHG